MAQLTDHEIHSIEDIIKEGYNDSQIARFVHKERSIISRLFKKYPRDWFTAIEVIKDRFKVKSQATQSHIRIKPWGELALYIHEKFLLDWSPDQIVESWKKKQKEKSQEESQEISSISVRLSKDTVYDWIYSKYTPKELKKHMRRSNKEYRNRIKEASLGWKYQMGKQKRIDERVEKYPNVWKRDIEWRRIEEIGHWEWDTVVWKDHKWAILTLVERKTWKTFIAELPLWKKAVWVTTALMRLCKTIPKDKLKTITFDNGREFADHKMMEVELKILYDMNVDIYFAYPYHSWERWTNENTNWLIRQYLPKKTDFTNIKQKDLNKIQILLNSRPRKRLNYSTPDQMFW